MRVRFEQNAELHVYVVPANLWSQRQHFTAQTVTQEVPSMGFVRLNDDMTLEEVRREIDAQLSGESRLPYEFYFVREVEQRLVQLVVRQETQLQVKHFLPPNVSALNIAISYSEIYV